MRGAWTILLAASAQAVAGQVQLSGSLRLVGDDDQRRVEGLAPPTEGSALVTLEGEAQGAWLWADAAAAGSSISLSLTPPLSDYRDGLLVRFIAPANVHGDISIAIDGLPSHPLLRPDGLPPAMGQVRAGSLIEALFAEGRFTLLSAPERGCPPQSVRVHDRLCIDAASPNGFLYEQAVTYCAARGGRLCAWDEYHAACVLVGSQLSSLFNQWEWIDDTSNHSHTADQAGRTTCQSQRSAGVPGTTLGEARCCYHPR
ncbi:MAG: hypothetical protein ACK4L7_07675 [Flavobacteriales bacterium]